MPNSELNREVLRMGELRNVCAKLHVELEALREVVADLSEACNAASAAHSALQQQVQQMADCIDSPPGAEAAPQLDYVSAMQGRVTDLERLLAAKRSLGASVVEAAKAVSEAGEGWQQHWTDAQGGAVGMRAALTTRANSWRPASRLLHLPDGPLHSIARLSGPGSRHICTRLRDAYGPATTIAPSFRTPPGGDHRHSEPSIIHIIESWSQPAAVLQLHLIAKGVALGPMFCEALPTALPNLQRLSCCTLTLPSDADVPRHTTLTSLTVRKAPAGLLSLAAFAPRLRAFNVLDLLCATDLAAGNVWGRLAALPDLRHLHLGPTVHSPQGAAFYAALPQHLPHLTHLTHLAIDCLTMPARADTLRALLRPLAALRELRSLELRNIDLAAPAADAAQAVAAPGAAGAVGAVGAALQALDLQRLVLTEVSRAFSAAPPAAHDFLPDASRMPSLQHLHLALRRSPLSAAVARRLLGAAAPALTSLHFDTEEEVDLALLVELLPLVPALTSLRFAEQRDAARGRSAAVPLPALAAALVQQTRLRELHFGTLPNELLQVLVALPLLTSLTLGERLPVGADDAPALEALTGLRHLALGLATQGQECCLEAVSKLPRLKHLELGRTMGCGGLLRVLLQAPLLRRVSAGSKRGFRNARKALGRSMVVDFGELAPWRDFIER